MQPLRPTSSHSRHKQMPTRFPSQHRPQSQTLPQKRQTQNRQNTRSQHSPRSLFLRTYTITQIPHQPITTQGNLMHRNKRPIQTHTQPLQPPKHNRPTLQTSSTRTQTHTHRQWSPTPCIQYKQKHTSSNKSSQTHRTQLPRLHSPTTIQISTRPYHKTQTRPYTRKTMSRNTIPTTQLQSQHRLHRHKRPPSSTRRRHRNTKIQ